MSEAPLRVALIDGPMYDPLYRNLENFERQTGIRVEVAFRGKHPELNDRLKRSFESGDEAFDVVSTHSKYAPSQAGHLLSLDAWFGKEKLADFAPDLIGLCRIGGELKGIPRNFDARLLAYRTDRLERLGLQAPATWDDLGEVARRAAAAGHAGVAFTGKGSGLFGTFFELLSSEEGRLFDERLQPAFHDGAGLKALERLRGWYAEGVTPAAVPEMDYDEVSASFRSGEATLATDWPGSFALMNEPSSPIAGQFALALMPAGSGGRRAVYCGSHTFAVTAASRSPERALRLLEFLTSADVQLVDARHGHVPVRSSVMSRMKRAADPDSPEARRLSLLEETIRTSVVIPPKFPEYPPTEDILWQMLRRGIVGELTPRQALDAAAAEIGRIVAHYANPS